MKMAEEVLITILNRPYTAAHNMYIKSFEDNVTCNTLSFLENKEKCTYIRDTKQCHEMDVLINYAKILYCQFVNVNYMFPFIAILILISILCVITTIVTAYSSLAPNVIAIIKHMNLSEFGGEIFAIGFSINLTSIINIRNIHFNDTELVLCEVFTSNIHLRCLCAGIFLIFQPIIANPLYYIRNQIFYLFGLVVTVYFTRFNKFDLVAAIIGVTLFIFLIFVVVVQENLSRLKNHKDDINVIHFKQENRYPVINPEDQSILKINRKQTFFKQFFASIEPRRLQLAYRSNIWQKVILIIGFPVNLFIALCIPVYHPLLPLNGWSKLLNLLNLFIFPSIFFFVIYIKIPRIIVYIYYGTATLFALYILFKSSANNPPGKCHIVFAYLGNIFCIGFIYVLETELEAILTVLGYYFQMERNSIGIYLLSGVKVLPICVLAATLASWDFHRMAFNIIMFSPIVLTNLTIAILILSKSIEQNAMNIIIRPGENGPTLLTLIFMEFFLTLIVAILLNFHLRKSFGYYLILLYLIFMLLTTLSDSQYIHSYGTDHTFEDYYVKSEANWA